MITVYAGSEVTGEQPAVHHLLEPIAFFRHDRDISYNRSVVVEALAAIEAEKNPQPGADKPAGTYNHYCPYSRIFNAIQEYCMGKARGDVLMWLFGQSPKKWLAAQVPAQGGQAVIAQDTSVLGKLGIRPSKEVEVVLRAIDDPLKCVLGFDIWLEWAIYSICDWPQNMFFGYGLGDGVGTKLDTPDEKKNPAAKLQTVRVQAAFKRLLDAIPGLSDESTVSVNKYAKIYTKAGQKQLGDMAHMTANETAAILKTTTAIEDAQSNESTAKKRKFIETSERFTYAQITDGTLGE